jgi:hypothetical protein
MVAAICAILAGILYIVSPIDAIPDVIPVFGLLDDVLVFAVSTLVGLGFGGSAIWLERRGRALAATKPPYEPVPADKIRAL